MAPRLLLVRHGRPMPVAAGGWITRAGVERWRAANDGAGISPGEAAPGALVQRCAGAARVVSSDLARAATSAARLAEGVPVERSPLLRESPLPIPRWERVRLPLALWECVIHAAWFRRRLLGGAESPEELARADAAAEWLAALASERSPVVAVTHGVFRHLLAARLGPRGWRRDSRLSGYHYWSVWGFERRD